MLQLCIPKEEKSSINPVGYEVVSRLVREGELDRNMHGRPGSRSASTSSLYVGPTKTLLYLIISCLLIIDGVHANLVQHGDRLQLGMHLTSVGLVPDQESNGLGSTRLSVNLHPAVYRDQLRRNQNEQQHIQLNAQRQQRNQQNIFRMQQLSNQQQMQREEATKQQQKEHETAWRLQFKQPQKEQPNQQHHQKKQLLNEQLQQLWRNWKLNEMKQQNAEIGTMMFSSPGRIDEVSKLESTALNDITKIVSDVTESNYNIGSKTSQPTTLSNDSGDVLLVQRIVQKRMESCRMVCEQIGEKLVQEEQRQMSQLQRPQQLQNYPAFIQSVAPPDTAYSQPSPLSVENDTSRDLPMSSAVKSSTSSYLPADEVAAEDRTKIGRELNASQLHNLTFGLWKKGNESKETGKQVVKSGETAQSLCEMRFCSEEKLLLYDDINDTDLDVNSNTDRNSDNIDSIVLDLKTGQSESNEATTNQMGKSAQNGNARGGKIARVRERRDTNIIPLKRDDEEFRISSFMAKVRNGKTVPLPTSKYQSSSMLIPRNYYQQSSPWFTRNGQMIKFKYTPPSYPSHGPMHEPYGSYIKYQPSSPSNGYQPMRSHGNGYANKPGSYGNIGIDFGTKPSIHGSSEMNSNDNGINGNAYKNREINEIVINGLSSSNKIPQDRYVDKGKQSYKYRDTNKVLSNGRGGGSKIPQDHNEDRGIPSNHYVDRPRTPFDGQGEERELQSSYERIFRPGRNVADINSRSKEQTDETGYNLDSGPMHRLAFDDAARSASKMKGMASNKTSSLPRQGTSSSTGAYLRDQPHYAVQFTNDLYPNSDQKMYYNNDTERGSSNSYKYYDNDDYPSHQYTENNSIGNLNANYDDGQIPFLRTYNGLNSEGRTENYNDDIQVNRRSGPETAEGEVYKTRINQNVPNGDGIPKVGGIGKRWANRVGRNGENWGKWLPVKFEEKRGWANRVGRRGETIDRTLAGALMDIVRLNKRWTSRVCADARCRPFQKDRAAFVACGQAFCS